MPFPGFNNNKKSESSKKEAAGEPDPDEKISKFAGGSDAGNEVAGESGAGSAPPADEENPSPVAGEPEEAPVLKEPAGSEKPGEEPVREPSEEISSPAPEFQITEPEEAFVPEEAPGEITRETPEEPSGSEKPGEGSVREPPEKLSSPAPEFQITKPEEASVPEEALEESARETPGEPPEEKMPGKEEEATLAGAEEEKDDFSHLKTQRKKKPGKALVQDEKKAFLFLKKKIETIRLYDFEIDGPLVEPVLPEGYTLIDEYWIHEGRSKVLIGKNPETRLDEYHLYEPKLSRFERELAERLYEDMRDVLILTDEEILEKRESVLMEKMSNLIHEYKVNIDDEALFKLQYYLLRNFLGWSRLDSLMFDPNIEDISCDGSDIPIFLYHRKYRNIRTNISFDEEVLYSLAILLAQRSGKHISVSQPMLDATLPDGSRLQLTLGKVVTSRGTSFTIRKFREEPFTPIELIEYGTFDVDQLVYFWLAIENNKSLLFVGGTASGKTTSLNAVSLFIPPLSKVVSIEDTREITLFHDNWIATVTREAATETSGSRIDMFDLLKAAMRQRPEYILVGEVRGVEAQTLFQAMNTGHTTFSTLHANNVDAAIHRLENPPLNVPRNMVQALDVVSIQALVYRGQERVRRALEIVEIAGIDPGTGNLRVNTVFEYDPVKDVHSYSGRSQVYSTIMEIRGWSREVMNYEIERRRQIIQAMHDQGIVDYVSVTKIFQAYFINSANVLENIGDLRKAFL